jgi:hypothetical protein
MKPSISVLAAAISIASAAPTRADAVTLPKGTSIEVRVLTAFDSDRAAKGQAFRAAVTRALYVGGRLAIPRDAVVVGEVKHVRSPRDGAKSAAIAVKFEDLLVGGRTHDIEGVLTSFQADERRKILDYAGKLTTGRKVDVVLIGSGTEPNRKASTLVGLSGEDREDLADEWAVSGLGPASVTVTPGTLLAMQLDAPLTVDAVAGAPAAGDRRIVVDAGEVRRAQEALKGRGLYAGAASGTLDEPTRRAIARFQIDQGQPATGDLDDATLRALSAPPPRP